MKDNDLFQTKNSLIIKDNKIAELKSIINELNEETKKIMKQNKKLKKLLDAKERQITRLKKMISARNNNGNSDLDWEINFYNLQQNYESLKRKYTKIERENKKPRKLIRLYRTKSLDYR